MIRWPLNTWTQLVGIVLAGNLAVTEERGLEVFTFFTLTGVRSGMHTLVVLVNMKGVEEMARSSKCSEDWKKFFRL